MTKTTGTNFFTKYTSTVDVALINGSGNAMLIACVAGSLPTDAGYAIGCIAIATDSGVLYYNTGTTTTASFTAVNAGAAALTLPTALTASSTTGAALAVTASGITTGIVDKQIAAAATMTTGRYYSANDGATEVWGIGANGHIHSTVSAVPPTIATNATGISACAITSGGSDTCGVVTTTGTPASGTVLTITFGKTYTTAPKYVGYMPTNAAAGGVNTMPIITTTATTAVFTWPAGGVYAATPSFMYLVIA